MSLDRAIAAPPPADASPDPRTQTIQFWIDKGAPPHVAAGIADRVNAESGFKPTIPGDAGTSIGLYQHHADRKARLMALPNWQTPLVQHQFAYSEVTGGDPIATKHWNEILAAPDRAAAAKLWDKYFERSAGGPGAAAADTGRMPGRFGGMGPRVPMPEDDTSGAVTPSRLARAMTPATEAPGVPIQIAPAPPPAGAAAMTAPATMPALAAQPGPPLRNTYRDALAAILAGRRRGVGSIFG